MKQSLLRIVSIFLIIGLNWTGFSAVGRTLAFFSDIETSSDNMIKAGSVDFSLQDITDWDPSENALSLFPGDMVSRDARIENEGTLRFNYRAKFEEISGDSPLCGQLTLDAKLEGVSQYVGPLADFLSGEFAHATSTDDWNFEVSLSEGASYDVQEQSCEFSFVFEGGQEGMPFGEGFWDKEMFDNTLASGVWSVVLNEFLPNPDGFEYGFDFGQDSDDIPRGEWGELYNNDTKSHNLSGWYIRDNSNSSANKILITELNTNLATSTIPASGWLVVYMNKAIFNNTSDTVRLFDNNDRLVDSHSYVASEFCDLEPTPGEENADDPSGACSGVPGNKSYARIPDGTGPWVDPIPTPGLPNVEEEEQDNSFAHEASASTTSEVSEHSEVPVSEEAPFIDESVDEIGNATSTSAHEGGYLDVSDALEPPDKKETNNDYQQEESTEEETLKEEPVVEEKQPIEIEEELDEATEGEKQQEQEQEEEVGDTNEAETSGIL